MSECRNAADLNRQAIAHLPGWMQRIVREVAEEFHVPPREIMGPCRKAQIVRARYAALARIKAYRPSVSAYRLGPLFNRDQSTIWYCFEKIKSGAAARSP